jgi:predicted dehydrogenase
VSTQARRLRTGLVGAGLVGQAGHAISLFEEPNRFEFAVVVDASATVREAVAARYHVPAARGSLEEALELGLDAVVVAVPDAAHCETVLTALGAGVHVFCEKPLTISLAECDAIIAARGDRVVQCGYMKLFDPAVERMVELLRAGDPQPVYLSVEVNDPDQAPFVDHLGLVAGRDVPRPLVEDLRARQARAVADALGAEPDAGQARAFEAFFGALVHDVSLAHHLLGAVGVHPPLTLSDAGYFDAGRGVSLTWDLPGDGCAHLTHLNLPGVAHYRERVTVYCRDRVLELTFPSPYLRHHPTRLVERRSDGTTGLLETEHRVSYEEAFRTELRAFHSAVTTGAPVRASVEAARDDIAALLDAVRLAAARQPLSLRSP